MNMSYGKNGMDLTKGFEKCRLTAYRDSGGVLTIGWGSTHHVTEGMTCTQAQADLDLLANVADAVDCVNDSVRVPLTQNQFDALVDFTFNVGCGAFKSSTLLRMLNAGDLQGAHDQLDRWVMDNGKRVQGLQNRRDAEQALFKKPVGSFHPIDPAPVPPAPVPPADPAPAKPSGFFAALMAFFASLRKNKQVSQSPTDTGA